MISTIYNTRNVKFVVNSAIKLRFFYPRPNVYILQEMDIWFLLATTCFRNPGFGTIFIRQNVGVKKVVSSIPIRMYIYTFQCLNFLPWKSRGYNTQFFYCITTVLCNVYNSIVTDIYPIYCMLYLNFSLVSANWSQARTVWF